MTSIIQIITQQELVWKESSRCYKFISRRLLYLSALIIKKTSFINNIENNDGDSIDLSISKYTVPIV